MGCFWFFVLVWWICEQEERESCENRRQLDDSDADDDCD